jgi:hypothetical protein
MQDECEGTDYGNSHPHKHEYSKEEEPLFLIGEELKRRLAVVLAHQKEANEL